jgi:hypothetical protein
MIHDSIMDSYLDQDGHSPPPLTELNMKLKILLFYFNIFIFFYTAYWTARHMHA